jgi:hypothetical protein
MLHDTQEMEMANNEYPSRQLFDPYGLAFRPATLLSRSAALICFIITAAPQ